jgi:hypothetical protein
MKYLQKRTYDISGELHEASSLTLLSQLVNAVSFGGLSNLTSKNLQNAMGGRMTINSLGRDLSNVAIKFQALPEETNRTRFDKIIARFIEGNVSTTGLTGPEKAAYDTVLRAGVYEMANLAFQKTDSLLIHKIIKEKSWLPTKLELLQLKVAFIQWTHLLYVLR